MSLLFKLILIALAMAALVLGAAYFGQRRLLYFPDRGRTAPSAVGLTNVQELVVAAPDGARIIHWWGKAKANQPTLLYFHGNAGSLADRTPRFERFMAEGWGVMMMSYRGFGGSDGAPTETDNVADALRAYDLLIAGSVPAGRIVIYGESLGTGVATQVAAQKPAAGLILDAPYTSIADVGAVRYPFLPVKSALKDRYETKVHISRVKCPVLVIHGTKDPVIPVWMGREIARLAGEPKTYVEFPNGGHIDLYINGNDALTPVRAFMQTLTRQRPFN